MLSLEGILTALASGIPIGVTLCAFRNPGLYRRVVFPITALSTFVATIFVGGMVMGADTAYFALYDFMDHARQSQALAAAKNARPSGVWFFVGALFAVYLWMLLALPSLPIITGKRRGSEHDDKRQ